MEDESKNSACNFKSSAISEDQRAKFRELQRRRLQMQKMTKNKRKSKDKKDKIPSANVGTEGCTNVDENLKDPGVKNSSKGENSEEVSSSSTSRDDVHPAFKKKKLHWGLDTKEWWERKANM